jgi:UDP-N-acetylmuramyl tripeptide synthase
MKSFRTAVALLAASGIRFGLRLFGKGATTLPGKTAMRISPRFLSDMSEDKKIIMITGTNGKTTTTHMITDILRTAGYHVETNVSGANLASGLATTLAEGVSTERAATRKGKETVYVLETDEAAFAKTAGALRPKVCLITNLFRDQLDRYGELLYTRDCIEKGLGQTDARVLLNADDSMISALRKGREKRVAFYGIDEATMRCNTVTNAGKPGAMASASDAEYCINCMQKFEYSGRSFGHFGLYLCPSCGDKRQDLDFSAGYDLSANPSNPGFEMTLSSGSELSKIILPIPGVHNIYNSIAAVSACMVFGQEVGDAGLSLSFCADALSRVKPAFGRMEKINVGGKTICLLLVKNPVGLDRSLALVSQASDADGIFLLLNSNIADGKDVSWIWDVDFESKTLPEKIYVSGERFAEMVLRIVYSGADKAGIKYRDMKNSEALFKEALEECAEGKCLYVLPNYTAMLSLRKMLVKKYHLKDFWK